MADSAANDILSPKGRANYSISPIAPRLTDLRGKRIGLLDNKKANADIVLDELGRVLEAEYGATVVLRLQKPDTARPASGYGYIDRLVDGVDAVINAYGDCGSCTSWCIHDSVDLEKRGIPVATINTDEFASLGQFDAIAKGLPGLPIVTVPHPIGDNLEPEARAKARDAAGGIVAALTGDARDVEQSFTNRYITRDAADRKEGLVCAL
ncbi:MULTISPECIES: UGSC family (seleno)protein [unclassified Sphingobium]|uniref:UGSC family (seleno)protein n=1 Tax=unclassified Sphingobium TaxID=2611147 RepID=UPI000D17BDBE|nr:MULTISPECIES: UGSC family (seleno)protein [unclassified Sphingobium]MBG6120147.1 hypothetical protein [Sphingobium sp. JAI105]PSO12816.1 hypothetical protein C7E20_03380 [Sphingobium sp. AEW4]TWD05652.1 hypothetical protein FB595_10912 [Sphingobium sp. AEW010]TWD23205.1 hypothetical protein FB596_10912 [Sphingobium sp. AEW013]TWD25065.1 hypothetical protein FB594_10912 [Sphingobium sp. AEW001]